MHVEKMETDGWVAGWVEEQTNIWPRCQHLTLLPFSQSIYIKTSAQAPPTCWSL